MKKHMFRITVIFLVIILAVVSFYMLYVHVPHYQYYHQLDEVRNEICESNNYQYMDYFYEYHGKESYYVIKVKIDGVDSYVVYNKKKELVDTFQGDVASKDDVKNAISEKYNIQVDDLDIGYENNKFVYYTKYQNDETLLYIYYDLSTGEFVKAVRLGDVKNG